MSIKCRSCGYINPDNKTSCDNCGCNLKYSKIFEKILENEKKTGDFLFELNESREQVDDNDFLIDSSEEKLIEPLNSEDDEYKPVSFPDPEKAKKQQKAKQMENNEKNFRKIGKLLSVELIEFLIFFLIILFFSKVFFTKFSISNKDLCKGSIVIYLFFNIHSYLLTGKKLSTHLIQSKTES